MIKIIVAGGRNYNDYEFLKLKLNEVLANLPEDDEIEITSGGATGADQMGERFADEYGLKLKVFPADWNKHGRAAGPIRNRNMAEYADCLVAFEGGRGTQNMIKTAKELGLKVYDFGGEG